MLRLCSLGSGSSGNATLIECRELIGCTRVLVDCGFSLRETEARLLRAGVEPASIDAIFVTHEHGDHVGSALAFARRHDAALWTSRGTWREIGADTGFDRPVHFARDGEVIGVGGLELRPFTVPHDAREPLQLTLGDGCWRIGVLTDVGMPTPHLLRHLQGVDALLLETNHDRGMLAASSYPPMLKARISSRHGHLANDLSSEVLAACAPARLQHLIAAHLSERNNRPELARAALASVVGAHDREIVVADPLLGFDWLALG